MKRKSRDTERLELYWGITHGSAPYVVRKVYFKRSTTTLKRFRSALDAAMRAEGRSHEDNYREAENY